MPVVWNARVAEGADEDRVERAKGVVAAGGYRDPGGQVVAGTPRELFDFVVAEGSQDVDRFGDDLGPNAVARDDRDGRQAAAPDLGLFIR